MLCLELTVVICAVGDNAIPCGNLVPSQLRKGAAFEEPTYAGWHPDNLGEIRNAQEFYLKNPYCRSAGCSSLWNVTHDIERLDHQEWLAANINAARKAGR